MTKDDSLSQFVCSKKEACKYPVINRGSLYVEKRELIADIIEGEAECGYLEYWREYREQLTDEQQRDYFLKIADLILEEKDE